MSSQKDSSLLNNDEKVDKMPMDKMEIEEEEEFFAESLNDNKTFAG
jgi:hypothetical protein